MVCKDDVVTWFKDLSGHKRIDLLCTLLNMCLPFELRYLGTCLEDLGKRDFHDLREAEIKSNNVSELSDLQCISDKRTQRKLALYLALLQTSNHACSNGLYKILANLDFNDISSNSDSSEENSLDELLLLYTLAINHPAFTCEQKTAFCNILSRLQDEENKLYAAKHHLGIGMVYVKPPIQSCMQSPLPEDRQPQEGALLGHCTGMPLPPTPPAVYFFPAVDMKGRSTIPPGLGIPSGIPDQLATSYVQFSFPTASQPVPTVPWPSGITPIVMTNLCGALPTDGPGDVSPHQSSPLVSRQSSPSQSGSPSRSGSPTRGNTGAERSSQSFKGPPVSTRRNNSTSTTPNCVDNTNHHQRPVSRKSSAENIDPLRETSGKDMTNSSKNIKDRSYEEVKRISDEDPKDSLKKDNSSINQLRAKLNSTNGINTLDKREPSYNSGRRKADHSELETNERKSTANIANNRRYPLEAAPYMYSPICFMPTPMPGRYATQVPPMYCVRLDSSSGASDSSSAGNSPPDTPSNIAWERERVNTNERWSPSADERSDKERRIPEVNEKLEEGNNSGTQMQTVHNSAISSNSRPRVPGGIGRSKTNPPGLQTIPRGRGPNPATVILEGNHKNLPSCRRDGTSVNGAPSRSNQPPPPPQHDDRKIYMVPGEMVHYSTVSANNQPPTATQYTSGNAPPRDISTGNNNVPYSPAFLPHGHFPTLRSSAIFPTFAPSNYPLRPTFPFSPNGELVYHQYHGHQTPPPPPFIPPVVYSPVVPPPKVSCYNCGSQNHHATECKESTMEDMTKGGQYRLDYSPYQKPGECSSEK